MKKSKSKDFIDKLLDYGLEMMEREKTRLPRLKIEQGESK